jgi:hypothetical protein
MIFNRFDFSRKVALMKKIESKLFFKKKIKAFLSEAQVEENSINVIALCLYPDRPRSNGLASLSSGRSTSASL